MTPRSIRRFCVLSSALLLAITGLTAPAALADPDDPDPVGTTAPAMPGTEGGTPGAESSAERVDVVVMLRDQPGTPSESAERSYLAAQDELLASWADRYGIEIDAQFGYLVNGFSASMPVDQLAPLSTEPQVASVRRERVYEPVEHTARQLEGVPAAFASHGTDGTGTVISIIDSGIDPSHQDMRLDDCGAAKIRSIDPAPEAGFTCKVPTGYNYADENMVIKDTTSSQHGMHVAGIAAANGSEGDEADDVLATGRVDGVAPNAQLLAMKVFSNSGGGARDSDIIAAIEDSVKLDADVINMSLGSPNGFKNTSDGTARAIEAARDAGVVTVVAAGNDGQNFSLTGEDDDYLGVLDDGTLGAPGSQGSALTVASIDNSVATDFVAVIGGAGDGQEIPYAAATGTLDDADHAIVDVGLGREQDYAAGQDLGGDWALIERGEIDFSTKFQLAIEHGAGGVVVFNSAAGGDVLFGMAGVEDVTIPGIVTTRTGGLAIREAIAAGPTTVQVTDDVSLTELDTALQPSSFTSWGTTPTLDFEPDVAGIGGSVYSTYNDDTYGTSSGTSMASPNVAGMMALLLEDQAADAGPAGPERVDLATAALMNTAQIPVDADGMPYSPRQVGAGLGRVDRALDTEVTATVEGRPSVALREITGKRSFTLTLTNAGDAERSYEIPAGQQVLAETNDPGAPTGVRAAAGSLTADATAVTVPAHGTAEVTFTLVPEVGADHFVGGWAQLAATTAGEPDLAVPYLGFVGDWNAEQILTPAGEELVEGLGVTTQLIGSADGATYPLELGDIRLRLSPNGDGQLDAISSQLALQRNAGDVRYEILRADGTPVKTLGMEQAVYRTLLADYIAVPDPQALTWTGVTFDGTVWDPQQATLVPVPDGEYIYRVSTRLSEDQDWQVTDLPFGVDATAPEVSIGRLEGTTLPLTVTDAGSGLLEAPLVAAADGTRLPVTDLGEGRYTVQIEDPQQTAVVTVTAQDLGLNTGTAGAMLSGEALVLADEQALGAEGAVIGEQSDLVTDGVLSLVGYVSADVATVEAGGADVPLEDGRFVAEVPLSEGAQEITVIARGADGTELARVAVAVTYDATPPQIALAEGTLDPQGRVALGEDGSVVLEGTVQDERAGAALGLTADGTEVPLGADGSFTATLTPGPDQTVIVLAASDGAGTGTLTLPIAGRESALPQPPGLVLTNLDCQLAQRACFVAGDSPDVSEDGSTFTLRGQVDPGIAEVVLTTARTVGEDGAWTGGEERPATIADDGSFLVELPVGTGENHVRLEARDEQGTTVLDLGLALYVDVVAPTLQVDEPVLHGGTLFTASETVRFAGTASDDGWGYTFALNDSTVTEVFYDSGLGAESNQRDFSEEISVADGDVILVQMSDANGNTLLGAIPVVLDAEAPGITVEGLAADQAVPAEQEVTASAADENLATLRVSVDGEVVDSRQTDLQTEQIAVEDALIDVRDLEMEESATATGASTRAQQDTLSSAVDLSALEPGAHTLTVESTDLAGNVSARTVPFAVAETIEIAGPDATELEIHREQLGDQAALAEQVLAAYTVESEGEAVDGASLALAPGTVLGEGESTVTLLAAGPGGGRAERTVTVTITLAQVTLRDGPASATGTFRSDDVLTAVRSDVDGGASWVLSNREEFAALDAVIVLPAQEGSNVVRVLDDGSRVTVTATWADGAVTFSGTSRATYLVLSPPDDDPDGDGDGGPGNGHGAGSGNGSGNGNGAGNGNGNGAGNGNGDGNGAGNGNGAGDGNGTGAGSGNGAGNGDGAGNGGAGEAAGAKGSGSLVTTGVEVAGVVILALLLLGAGAALVLRGRRR